MNIINNKWSLIFGILCFMVGEVSSQILPPSCTPSPGVFTQKPCAGNLPDVVTRDTLCGGEVYTWPVNQTTYTDPGIYTVASTDDNGCTYNEVLMLMFHEPTSNVTTSAEFCTGDTYVWAANNTSYSAPGTYTVTKTDMNGCQYVELLVLSLGLSGCTDPLASNYDPNASCNDGSCEVVVEIFGCICGDTWNDANANGVQDAGESKRPNVSVTLLDLQGTVIGTTTTDGAGSYCFLAIPAGSFIVQFETIASAPFTLSNVGPNEALDSDANASTGFTNTILLAEGQCDTDTDAGYSILLNAKHGE